MPSSRINLYIVKVFDASGSAPSSVIARGMIACLRARADVVSMSLGGDKQAESKREQPTGWMSTTSW